MTRPWVQYTSNLCNFNEVETAKIFNQTGFLEPGQYLIHDRDTKYCEAFTQIIDDAGVKHLPLPPRSPWLNAFAERWVKSVKDEALSRMILFGERSSVAERYYSFPRTVSV